MVTEASGDSRSFPRRGHIASTPAQAQIPDSVIPYLDLKCYGITDPNGGPLPALNFPLHLDHLNPLFQQLGIPPEDVLLLDPFQLCVPVAKNGVIPPGEAREYIQYIDLKCYHMETDPTPLNLGLVLIHLNPVLHGFQPEFVTVQDPQKGCVPVAKTLPDGTPLIPPLRPSCSRSNSSTRRATAYSIPAGTRCLRWVS